MKKLFPISNLIVTMLIITGCHTADNTTINNAGSETEIAIERFNTDFPEGQLADLYKSFYQDAFGPGHILGDTVSARQYLRYELSDTTEWRGPTTEYAGEGKNFIRVNMKLIKDNVVPEDVFFNAFVGSLQRVETPDSAEWTRHWQEVDSIIAAKGNAYPNEEEDRKLIEEKLRSGKFTMHHSDSFNSTYNYHYRIIAIPVFEEILLPYIEPKQ